MGRIHLGVQDMMDLQTRKTKALKRGRDPRVGEKAGTRDVDQDVGQDEGLELNPPKKPRVT